MKHSKHVISTMFVLLMGGTLIGCQGEMVASDPVLKEAVGEQTAVSISFSIDEVDQSTEAADLAMEEAMKAIAKLDDGNGGITLDGLQAPSGGVSTQGLFGIEERLNKVFDKAVAALSKATGLVDVARGKLDEAKAKLNPTNPAHILALQKLDELYSRLDEMEDRMHGVLVKVADKIDHVQKLIDEKLQRLAGSIAQIPLYMLASEVQMSLTRFKNKILAL